MIQLLQSWPFWGLVGFVVVYFLIDRRFPKAMNTFEESVIALLLAAMAIVTFSQVVARYGFNTGWTGALELTQILFAWLILFGMSYGVKIGSHLGVDAMIRQLPPRMFRAISIFGAAACVLYAVILISGDWLNLFGAGTRGGGALYYWERMYNAGIGLEDLRYPVWFQDMFGIQERFHRWVAYLILPIGLGLLAFRCIQAMVKIIRGEKETMIAAHEAEDLVAEHKDAAR